MSDQVEAKGTIPINMGSQTTAPPVPNPDLPDTSYSESRACLLVGPVPCRRGLSLCHSCEQMTLHVVMLVTLTPFTFGPVS